ncbi:MAG: MaoC/PaaZ C-terminal domain-containing protein [Myxococcota bacterium]|nr:MaoC/PaaZ C-terminal domain-containing protein [Myxococcota bacterium]
MTRGLYFSDFHIGQEFTSGRRTITETDLVLFAGFTGDYNPLHTDVIFARTTRFKQRIAHGMLVTSISTGLVHALGIFDGSVIGLMSQSFQYKAPTFIGDTIHIKLTVMSTNLSSKGGKGRVVFKADIFKHDDTLVNTGDWMLMFKDKPKSQGT